MNVKLLILSVCALILFGTTNLCAQKAQRITFKKGAKQATLTGTLKSYRGKRVFLLRVRRGQTLSTEQIKSDSSSHYITVFITAPNGKEAGDADASCNNRKRVSPTRAGDYRIEVVECQKADAWRGSFRLKVRVE